MFWNALIEIFAMGHQPSASNSPQLEGLRPPLKAVGSRTAAAASSEQKAGLLLSGRLAALLRGTTSGWPINREGTPHNLRAVAVSGASSPPMSAFNLLHPSQRAV
jgi:hypothetical protein